jgi:hypothetical protein
MGKKSSRDRALGFECVLFLGQDRRPGAAYQQILVTRKTIQPETPTRPSRVQPPCRMPTSESTMAAIGLRETVPTSSSTLSAGGCQRAHGPRELARAFVRLMLSSAITLARSTAARPRSRAAATYVLTVKAFRRIDDDPRGTCAPVRTGPFPKKRPVQRITRQ